MTTNIEQMRLNIDKMRADIKADRRKVTLQTLGLVITAFASGIAALALLNTYLHH